MADDSNQPTWLERLSHLLLREPEDREQLIELLHSAYEKNLLDADALAMIGQHTVYCQSSRMPGRPTLDIALVIEQIGDAKELVQTVIEQKPE